MVWICTVQDRGARPVTTYVCLDIHSFQEELGCWFISSSASHYPRILRIACVLFGLVAVCLNHNTDTYMRKFVGGEISNAILISLKGQCIASLD